MRSIPRWIKVSATTLLAISAAGILLLNIAGIYLVYRKDFNTEPPNQVFRMVFERLPPPGVTVSHVSGRHYFTKRWVWMRLQMEPGAINSLLSDFVASKPEKLSMSAGFQEILRKRVGDNRYVVLDQKRVGWSDVTHISQPEVYTFFTGPPLNGKEGWLWSGVVIVNRKNHIVFVHAIGD